MALRYRVPLPGPFCYSGRVGPGSWFPHGSHTGPGPIGFMVKWFIIYPSIAIFVAGLAIMVAPFYGLVWVVRRSLRRRQRCQPVARCSLFSGLSRSVRRRALGRGRMVLSRPGSLSLDPVYAPSRKVRARWVVGIASSVLWSHGAEDAVICSPSPDVPGVVG